MTSSAPLSCAIAFLPCKSASWRCAERRGAASPANSSLSVRGSQGWSSTVDVREQIERFPRSPGVYLMKDAAGRIIYVGKAKNLRSRVRQYYSQSGDPRYHI